MNNELKLKWHSIYGQILHDRKLMSAWKQVKVNKGCGGIKFVRYCDDFLLFAKSEEENQRCN